MATSATAKIFNDADVKRKTVAVQGPASGQVANVGQLLSLLQDQKLLPPTETANPPGTSAHSDENQDTDGSELSDLEPVLAKVFSEASRRRQLPAQVGLRHLDLPQSAAGHIQVVGRPEDQNLGPQAKPQPASGLRTRRSSLRLQAIIRRSNLRRPAFVP